MFRIYSNVRLILFNYGSVVLLLVFNCLLIDSLIRSNKSIGLNTRRQKSLTFTVIFLISLILAAEFLCTLLSPASAIVIWGRDIVRQPVFRIFHIVAVLLMLIEYSCSFIVLCACSDAYRRLLLSKLFRWNFERRGSTNEPNNTLAYRQRISNAAYDGKPFINR